MHTSTWKPPGQNRYISTLTYEPLHHCDHNMNNLLVVLRGITLDIHIGFAIQFMLKETSHPFRICHITLVWTGKQFVGDSWRPSCTLQAALSVKFISHWNLQLCSTISLKFVWTQVELEGNVLSAEGTALLVTRRLGLWTTCWRHILHIVLWLQCTNIWKTTLVYLNGYGFYLLWTQALSQCLPHLRGKYPLQGGEAGL